MEFSLTTQCFSMTYANDVYGILIREDDYSYDIISPLAFFWLGRIGRAKWVSLVQPQNITKQMTHTRTVQRTFRFPDWMFDFPFSKEDIPYFHHICSFFQQLLANQEQVDAATLERWINMWASYFPFHVLQGLITFLAGHAVHPKERLRFLLSPAIQSYIAP